MRCERFREAASARLDGEPIGMSASVLDHHVATCPDCARWVERTARLTREMRLRGPDAPDLTEQIIAGAALPARRVLLHGRSLRAVLLVVGLAQLAIAVPSLFDDSVGMAMAAHASHESAAWNLAIAAAFVAAALRPRLAAGTIPLLVTFVLALAALSVHDLVDGAVGPERLATHLAALVGLVLLLAVNRAERALPPGSSAGATARHDGDEHGDKPGGLRGVA